MSVATYTSGILAQKSALADNLETMGRTATVAEPLADLVAKVLDISDDADAAAGNILNSKTAYVGGAKITGTMPVNNSNNVEVTDIDGTLIPTGYYNGSGSAILSATEAAKVIAENIKDGVTILGVLGTLSGASILTGDALVGDVLAGKTFYSNDPDTQLTGTMPVNEGDNACSSSSVSGTTLKLVAPTGFYDGDDTVTITDADFVAANIKSGVDVLGITGTLTAVTDDDAYTVSMLHFDGANNGTTFTDAKGKTWTGAGTAQTSTVDKVYGTASLLLDGNSDYIYTDDSDDFYFSNGAFTIDFWVKRTTISAGIWTVYQHGADVNNRIVIYFNNQDLEFYAITSSSIVAYYSATAVVSSTSLWYHIAIVRSGSNFYMFVNGLSKTLTVTTAISTNSLPNISAPVYIGVRKYPGTEDRYYIGYIDEFRISKGIARWTADFVPGRAYVV
jgi:hypothetical protein